MMITDFVDNIGSIFDDLKTSDVGEGHCWKCEVLLSQKPSLSARCEVFKNMLAPHTTESENNTIEIKEVPSEAVKTILVSLSHSPS
jgi:hypothetical protein